MKKNKSNKKEVFNFFIERVEKFFKKTSLLYKENKIVFFYVFGCLINGILLRFLTIGSVFAFSQVFADICVSIFFSSIYFYIKKERRFWYLFIMSIFTSIICLANVVYYFYYSSFISITFISFALTNTETGGSDVVGGLLQIKYFIFIWFPIALAIINYLLKKKPILHNRISIKNCLRITYIWGLIFLGLLLCTLKGVDYGRFYSQWNREYLVNRFGVYLYQINDVVKSVEPKMTTLFGSDKAYKDINEFYEDRSNKQDYTNEYTKIFKDKNVIAVHAESIQNALIGMKINGVEITPNLNKLAKTGLYFSNFYSQVSFGTSSDTEFTVATSLLPVKSGSVFINFSDREYVTMYKLLQEQGYYTFSMHANTGDFWNRNIMHKNLGYDKFYEKSSYQIDEEVGFGLSDKSFINQSVNYIKEIDKTNEKYYGTLITLSNHTPFNYNELFKKLDLTKTVKGVKYQYMEDTKLGNYFVSAHYADQQLGLLVSKLEQEGLLDDTIIMIYGDHDARISKSQWNRFYNYDYKTNDVLDETDESYQELDYYWQELNRSVPLFVWTNDKNFQKDYAKEVDTAMGMYDIVPTLGNMLGFYDKYALGHDIMELNDNLVVFPNGNYLTNYVYYNDNKGQYKLLKNVPLKEDYIQKNKEKTEKLLDISNDIITYNYFKKELSDHDYIKEE